LGSWCDKHWLPVDLRVVTGKTNENSIFQPIVADFLEMCPHKWEVFLYDVIHDVYVLNANPMVRENLPLNHDLANTPEELAGFSNRSKLQFLQEGKRVGKQVWKQLRFVFDHHKHAWLDIYTYHGYMLRITQDRCEMCFMQIPGINRRVDTYYLKMQMKFDSIELCGSVNLLISREILI